MIEKNRSHAEHAKLDVVPYDETGNVYSFVPDPSLCNRDAFVSITSNRSIPPFISYDAILFMCEYSE